MLRLSYAAGVVAHGLTTDLHGTGIDPGLVGQVGKKGHPGEHAIAGLLKVNRSGIVVHVDVDLGHAGEGVHD